MLNGSFVAITWYVLQFRIAESVDLLTKQAESKLEVIFNLQFGG
jgi:hypothetical protein